VKIANSALADCLDGGGSQDRCEASAIRQANAAAKEVSEAAAESALELVGDIIPLVEGKLSANGRTPIKLIAPGWGTSGFYPADVLERDGPQIFKAGTQMFWDHPKRTDERDRPERSLRDLAAVLVSDAAWMPEHPKGPGLYAEAAVYTPYRERLAELAPNIGVSILAYGAAVKAEREGKKGLVIQEITSRRSVDFVTVAGAGGQVVQLFESARGDPPEKTTEVKKVEPQEAQELKDQNAALKAELLKIQQDTKTAAAKAQESITTLQQNVDRHNEADQLRAAQTIVAEVLEANKEKLPDVTVIRLQASLARSFPTDDKGVLKEADYRLLLEKAIKDEVDYVAKIKKVGEIRGMGSAGGGSPQETAGLIESFSATFQAQGIAPEEAKRMAELAAAGR